MYFLCGFDESVRNVYLVSHPHLHQRVVRSITDLRAPYLDFLSAALPHAPVNRQSDPFVVDDEIEARLAAAFGGSALDDMQQGSIIGGSYDHDDKRARHEFGRRCLVDLLARDEHYAAMFELVIHSIFVTRTNKTSNGYQSHGGSASGAIGTIWLSMRSDLSEIDVIEMYVHEMTHQLLFLDELVHGHFDYGKIPHEENFAYSAILNRIRPLDKVVHSIVVATEVLLARRCLQFTETGRSIHPDSERLAKEALHAISTVNALSNVAQLVTPRVLQLLARCRSVCEAIPLPTGAAR